MLALSDIHPPQSPGSKVKKETSQLLCQPQVTLPLKLLLTILLENQSFAFAVSLNNDGNIDAYAKNS